MEPFSDYYHVFPDPIGASSPIFDAENKELQYDVTEHLLDRQYNEFAPGIGLASPHSREIIAAHYINISNAGDSAPWHLYESTMKSLGLQKIINPIITSGVQAAAAAFSAPSVGVDHGERPAYPMPQNMDREEIMASDASHLLYRTTPDGGSCMEIPLLKPNPYYWQVKNEKTDPHLSKSVLAAPLKKSKSTRCKPLPSSSASAGKSNLEVDVIRREPPELMSNIVTKKEKAESRKDYIHVRTRRGQATDNHSLAERVRRQKINDRMNILQNLVPGCNKITSTALVLEEIINYVHSLQNQVEILSMKLASTSPVCTFDHQITGHHFKQILPLEATTDPVCLRNYPSLR